MTIQQELSLELSMQNHMIDSKKSPTYQFFKKKIVTKILSIVGLQVEIEIIISLLIY
jgi:hypothetical protein